MDKSKEHPEIQDIKNICEVSPKTKNTKNVCDKIASDKPAKPVQDSANPGNRYAKENQKPKDLEKKGFQANLQNKKK